MALSLEFFEIITARLTILPIADGESPLSALPHPYPG
jgi:hypothetical protein